ncbi:hypothetical protein X474_11045 [Dethiosulfatarculus sandiegensis]|uniref:Uncharacterized protein n=1 Tax=Dethiosulfatarculus sandiegensis TaxID=1429043 RepID=A0A0D2HTJ9_9BACT|nr:hypothetical protein X474_11045 [Dethiosulfatarculus sandiegensis]
MKGFGIMGPNTETGSSMGQPAVNLLFFPGRDEKSRQAVLL